MTREEAIENIKEHCYFANLIPQAKEALDMAIRALEDMIQLTDMQPCSYCKHHKIIFENDGFYDGCVKLECQFEVGNGTVKIGGE